MNSAWEKPPPLAKQLALNIHVLCYKILRYLKKAGGKTQTLHTFYLLLQCQQFQVIWVQTSPVVQLQMFIWGGGDPPKVVQWFDNCNRDKTMSLQCQMSAGKCKKSA